jgi:Zn-dependent M28 family amino/carboxypeptidase
VERNGYEVAGVAAQNLAVTVPGAELGKEVIVVGAHYDSRRGSRGENDNASGVAALLELSRMLRGARSSRTLRLVAFAVSEPPFAGSDDMGSARYVKHLVEASEQVVTMINLDRIGTLSEWPGQGPARVRLGAASGGSALAGRLEDELSGEPLVIDSEALDAAPSSDHWAFARQGIPAVWLSGAGRSEVVDYDAMTRLVMRLRFALATLLGETPTNDGMLTPDLSGVR